MSVKLFDLRPGAYYRRCFYIYKARSSLWHYWIT